MTLLMLLPLGCGGYVYRQWQPACVPPLRANQLISHQRSNTEMPLQMVIPHTAIVASAMLASNNPTALEGILGYRAPFASLPVPELWWSRLFTKLGGRRLRIPGKNPTWWIRSLRKMQGWSPVEAAYETSFMPTSLWLRGPNKKRWVDQTIDGDGLDPHWQDHGSERLKKRLSLSSDDFFDILVRMLVLLGGPFALAFTTSYLTPRAGKWTCLRLPFRS